MKNIKNTVVAMAMMAVIGVGTATANPGLMVSDRSAAPGQTICGSETSILNDLEGIIIVGLASSKVGLMVSDRLGLMVSDRSAQCTQNNVEGQNGDGILIVG